MTGEEVKNIIKSRGMNLATVAKHLGTSPQNLNNRLNAKSIRIDFLQSIMDIINNCCPPLPVEVEASVIGSAVNGSHSPNVTQSIGGDAALVAENKLLRQQNEFLQQRLAEAMEIIKNGKG